MVYRILRSRYAKFVNGFQPGSSCPWSLLDNFSEPVAANACKWPSLKWRENCRAKIIKGCWPLVFNCGAKFFPLADAYKCKSSFFYDARSRLRKAVVSATAQSEMLRNLYATVQCLVLNGLTSEIRREVFSRLFVFSSRRVSLFVWRMSNTCAIRIQSFNCSLLVCCWRLFNPLVLLSWACI